MLPVRPFLFVVACCGGGDGDDDDEDEDEDWDNSIACCVVVDDVDVGKDSLGMGNDILLCCLLCVLFVVCWFSSV